MYICVRLSVPAFEQNCVQSSVCVCRCVSVSMSVSVSVALCVSSIAKTAGPILIKIYKNTL